MELRHDPPTVMELTKDELVAIADDLGLGDKAYGIATANTSPNNVKSNLRSMLAASLHSMTCRGELTLCSRAERRGEFPCPTHPMER